MLLGIHFIYTLISFKNEIYVSIFHHPLLHLIFIVLPIIIIAHYELRGDGNGGVLARCRLVLDVDHEDLIDTSVFWFLLV